MDIVCEVGVVVYMWQELIIDVADAHVVGGSAESQIHVDRY